MSFLPSIYNRLPERQTVVNDNKSYELVEAPPSSNAEPRLLCAKCRGCYLPPSVHSSFVASGRFEPNSPPPVTTLGTYTRAAPGLDLTRFGIEPNPGPGKAPPAVVQRPIFERAIVRAIDETPHAVKDAVNSAGNTIGKGHAKRVDSFGKALTAGVERTADSISKLLRLRSRQTNAEKNAWAAVNSKPSYPPIPAYLVGVEPNPGPTNKKKSGAQKQKQKQPVHPKVQLSKALFAPAAESQSYHGRQPKITHTKDGVTIAHTERLASVTGTTTFSVNAYTMQPGMSQIFQWLRTQSTGWEKYKWTKLIFHYVPRTGSGTNGSVMMAFDYDVYDAVPSGESVMASYENYSDDACWKTQHLRVDMKHSPELFIRGGPIATADLKTYDFGNLFLGTNDGTAVTWGKVYVEYEVKFFSQQATIATYVGGAVAEGGGGVTPTFPFGLVPFINSGSILVSVAADVITLTNMFPGQKYLVTIYVGGTVITDVVGTGNIGGSMNVLPSMPVINSASTRLVKHWQLIPGLASGTITMAPAASTITFCQCTISPCNF